MWEIGEVTATFPDGSVIKESGRSLQVNAPKAFANDFEAQEYANLFVREWIQKNISIYPALVWKRLINTVTDTDVHLTKLPREDLFLLGAGDSLLVDKSPWLIALGLLGLCLYPLFFSRATAILFLVAVAPWVMGGLFLSTARILEPTLPLVLFGNILLVDLICRRFLLNRSAQLERS